MIFFLSHGKSWPQIKVRRSNDTKLLWQWEEEDEHIEHCQLWIWIGAMMVSTWWPCVQCVQCTVPVCTGCTVHTAPCSAPARSWCPPVGPRTPHTQWYNIIITHTITHTRYLVTKWSVVSVTVMRSCDHEWQRVTNTQIVWKVRIQEIRKLYYRGATDKYFHKQQT